MQDARVRNKLSVSSTEKPEAPKKVHIALSVCGCYSSERIVFVTARAQCVSRALGISIQDLECAAVNAMFTGTPQVVGSYSREIAETKLAQLNADTPFIARACHEFDIIE